MSFIELPIEQEAGLAPHLVWALYGS